MIEISDYITLDRFCQSENARRKGIDNTASDPAHLTNIIALMDLVYDPLCQHFGQEIFVSSGYRSLALNLITKGASVTSQHAKGEAVDLDQDGQEGPANVDLFYWLKDNVEFDQLIWEFGDTTKPSWVHVSYTRHRKNRRQILRAIPNPTNSTLTKYLPWSATL